MNGYRTEMQCPECGCRFYAGKEYIVENEDYYNPMPIPVYSCNCPDCGCNVTKLVRDAKVF